MVSGARDRAWRKAGVVALLLVAIGAVYGQALGHEFLNYDDDIYVTGNRPLEQGLSVEGVRWAFGSVVGGNWSPLTLTSYLLDQEVHGLSPAGVHASNVLLH